MKDNVRQEVEMLIDELEMDCTIEEFQDKVYWLYITECLDFSPDFVRKYKDKLDWIYISSNAELSEDFIREFADYVNWDCIFEYQDLSDAFRKEFECKLEEQDDE